MKFSSYKLQDILSELHPKQIGDELIIDCPYCGHRETYINTVKNKNPWQCWRKAHCGESGTIYKLLYKLGKQNLLKEYAPNIQHEKIILVQPQKTIEDVPTINLPLGYQRIYNHSYFHKRGANVPPIEFGICKTMPKLFDRIIFPVYENGEVKGYVGRDTTDKKKNKYYNTPGVDFGKLLFGLDSIQNDTKTVILVEGIFDKLNVDDILGLDGIPGIRCLATFGCKISEEQINKLYNKCPDCNVILMYDADAIGAMQQYSFDIALKFHTQIAKIPWKDKDPGNMNLKELLQVLDSLWSPYDYFVRHLNIQLNESKNYIGT